MNKILPAAAAVVTIFLVWAIFINRQTTGDTAPATNKPTMSTVQIGQTLVNVEIADTPEKMALGLGERDSLPEDSGMLFVYGTKTPAVFWMKGMRFPLDIIWIADNKVVDIHEKVPHEPGVVDNELKRYLPNQLVDSVLEVNAGFVEKNNTKIGDSVQMQSYP